MQQTSTEKTTSVVLIFVLSFLVFIQTTVYILSNLQGQIFLFTISLFFFIALLLFSKFYPTYIDKPLLQIVQIACIAIIFFLFWNYAFRKYIETNNYHSGVFGNSFDNYVAPLYGRERKTHLEHWLILLIPFVVLLGFLKIKRLKKTATNYSLLFFCIFTLLIILLYSFLTGLNNFITPMVHYKTYAQGLPFFSSLTDLLKNYVVRMHELGIHNSHYPPGNLIVLKMEELFQIPVFAKLFVIVCVSLSAIPMNGIMNELSLSTNAKTLCFISLATFSGITIFSNNDPQTCITLFSTASVYFFIKSIRTKKILHAVLFGISMSVFTFFSFVSSVLMLLLVLIASDCIRKKKFKISGVLFTICLGMAIFFSLFFTLYFFFGFNILECFANAVANNRESMGTNGYDSLPRYLLRSSGNLIAYIISLGVINAGLFLLYIFRKDNSGNEFSKSFAISIAFTLLIASFSGLFFFETERIWTFLIPLIAVVTGTQLYGLFETAENNKSLLTILFAFLISIAQQLHFYHYV